MRKKNNKLFLFLATILALASSCGDMDSIHQDYLDGEEVYAGKLDTLNVRPGYYRAQLEGQTQFLGNSCLLYTSPSPRDATLSRMPSSA